MDDPSPMQHVESFLESHPMVTERPFTEDELAKLVGQVPEQVVALLSRVGRTTRGFLTTQLPGENSQLLEAWGIDPAKAHLFMTSSLGLLVFATRDAIFALDPHTGSVTEAEPYIAFTLLFMDVFTWYPELEGRGLEKEPLEVGETWGIFPPLKLGGKLGNAYGAKPTVTFRKVPRDEHAPYLASLFSNKPKGLPRGLKLPASRAPKPVPKPVLTATASAEATFAFSDAGLHYAVVSALFALDAISLEELHAALRAHAEVGEEDDEHEHIARAVKALKKLRIRESQLVKVTALGRDLAFEATFEQLVGVETGGEDDYMAVTSLREIERLTELARLDLESVTFDSKKAPDLAPLASLPALRELVLGRNVPKKLDALAKLTSLEKLTLPEAVTLPPKLAKALAERGVVVART